MAQFNEAAIKANPLGYEPVGKLMLRFSIPAVVAMVINSIYNIVDQIFIGWGVGYLGNASTNIIVPLVTIVIALALLIGDGSASFIALNLGVGKVDTAKRSAGNSLGLVFVVGCVLCAFSIIFMTPICRAFGATENILPYAVDYGRIIAAGFPISILGGAMAGLLRADGRPRLSMIGMILGCVTNMILDPIFIFVFGWGVKGAAFATILGQAVNLIYFIIFGVRKMQTVPFTWADFKPDFRIIGKFLQLGISSFINQCASVVVIVLMNRSILKYGAMSIYGADIALAVFGIVMKVNMVITCVPIGISSGSAPIVGFNYSAGQYDRVKSVLKRAWIISTAVMIAAFVIYHVFPAQLIGMFGQESALYQEFGVICFKINTLACFLMPTSACIGIFFQAVGHPTQSAIVSLARQVLVLIPALIIFGKIGGLIGLLYSGPASDLIAAIIASVALLISWKKIFSEGGAAKFTGN